MREINKRNLRKSLQRHFLNFVKMCSTSGVALGIRPDTDNASEL